MYSSHLSTMMAGPCEAGMLPSKPLPAVVHPFNLELPRGYPCAIHSLDAASISNSSLSASIPAPLPAKRGFRLYRWLRWNFGSVYRRIFTLVYLSNLAVLAVLAVQTMSGARPSLTYTSCTTAVNANILASLLVRNEHVVNAMFLVFGSLPKRAPLSLRRLFAKVYSYGGIHSGCAVAATFWYAGHLALITHEFTGGEIALRRGYLLLVSYVILFLLVTVLIFAHPRIRVLVHNWFEGIHRTFGWSIVALFWVETLMLAAEAADAERIPMAMALVTSPGFWMLTTTTLLVIYPWTHLRLRDVEAEVLSEHAVRLKFDYANVNYGQAVRLTDAPLKETHAFAVIPNPRPSSPQTSSSSSSLSTVEKSCTPGAGGKGFSVLVSNAGDWTKRIIKNPPKKIWTRGLPQYGVLRVAGLFEPVIVVATGSGIGPCLSLFVQKPDHPVRIIWSAADPAGTYGQPVIDTILRTDPNAVIIDTRKSGRPDLVAEIHRVWESSRMRSSWEFAPGKGRDGGKSGDAMGPCEAVVIISNQKVTKKVVYGLESRGIPAYGAIFDS